MSRSIRYALGSSLLALGIGASTPASATMIAAICNDAACTGGDDFFTSDNAAGDTIPSSGVINFSTSAFGYTILVNTSQSRPAIGSATNPQLDLNFAATTGAAGAGTVFLYVSDTGFTGSGQYLLSFGGTNSGGSGSEVGRAWGGTDNTALSVSPSNLFAALTESGAAFSNTTGGAFSPSANPYSLTIGTSISRSTAGTTTGDLNLQIGAVPEASTWAMMLLGFGGIGLAVRRRKALKAVIA